MRGSVQQNNQALLEAIRATLPDTPSSLRYEPQQAAGEGYHHHGEGRWQLSYRGVCAVPVLELFRDSVVFGRQCRRMLRWQGGGTGCWLCNLLAAVAQPDMWW